MNSLTSENITLRVDVYVGPYYSYVEDIVICLYNSYHFNGSIYIFFNKINYKPFNNVKSLYLDIMLYMLQIYLQNMYIFSSVIMTSTCFDNNTNCFISKQLL